MIDISLTIPPSFVGVAQKRIPQRIPFANFHVLIRGNDASDRRTYIIPQIGTQPQIRDGNVKRVRGTRGDNNGIRKIGQGRDAALPLSCNVSLEYHLVGICLRIWVAGIDSGEEVHFEWGRIGRWRAGHVNVKACDEDGLTFCFDGENVSVG